MDEDLAFYIRHLAFSIRIHKKQVRSAFKDLPKTISDRDAPGTASVLEHYYKDIERLASKQNVLSIVDDEYKGRYELLTALKKAHSARNILDEDFAEAAERLFS